MHACFYKITQTRKIVNQAVDNLMVHHRKSMHQCLFTPSKGPCVCVEGGGGEGGGGGGGGGEGESLKKFWLDSVKRLRMR